MRRVIVLAVSLGLLVSACSDDGADPRRPEPTSASSAAAPAPPTPAEALGLVEGWGPTAAELFGSFSPKA